MRTHLQVNAMDKDNRNKAFVSSEFFNELTKQWRAEAEVRARCWLPQHLARKLSRVICRWCADAAVSAVQLRS